MTDWKKPTATPKNVFYVIEQDSLEPLISALISALCPVITKVVEDEIRRVLGNINDPYKDWPELLTLVKAAKLLGISTRTVAKRFKKWGLLEAEGGGYPKQRVIEAINKDPFQKMKK